MIEVDTTFHQSRHAFDESLVKEAARTVLEGEGIGQATISIAVVDAATIQKLNCQFLRHDHVTDVLSFPLGQDGGVLQGEVVVCADMAAEVAGDYGWRPMDELLLYVVHGVLHLVGYDDSSAAARVTMREREKAYLAHFGLQPSYDDRPAVGKKVAHSESNSAID